MANPIPRGDAGLDEDGRKRLAFLGFGEADEANLVEIREFLRTNIDEIIDGFYSHLLKFEGTRKFLRDDAQVARLKKLQRDYFLRMTEGSIDGEYFESRLRVGAAHARIDVEPQWYMGVFSLFLRLVSNRLQEHYRDDPDRLHAVIESLSKLVFLDMGLVIESYIMSGYVDRALAQEYRRMADVAERTLREKAELERMKGDLTNMIVHDLKGPLGGILTVTQLALRKRGERTETYTRHFQQIQRSARELMRMTENLLEIDQMEEGRLELRVEPVEVGRLLDECADEFRAAAEMSGQSITVTVDEDVPVIVTDRWLLRRVLNNLVVNAVRHSGAAGLINLEAAADSGVVHVRVCDAGRGIPLEEQSVLFSKDGRRAGRHRSRDDTGLGLVFCKMAVDIMEGAIAVESAPGKGAIFSVTLPVVVAG